MAWPTLISLFGESGCGKSITARSILRIEPNPGKIVEGQILYHRPAGSSNGASTSSEVIDLVQLDHQSDEIRDIRGGEISMIFQEPMISLSPVHTIGNQIMEVIQSHQDLDKKRFEIMPLKCWTMWACLSQSGPLTAIRIS